MKAYSLHKIGDIRMEEVDKPKAGEQDVIVKVKAAGSRQDSSGAVYHA